MVEIELVPAAEKLFDGFDERRHALEQAKDLALVVAALNLLLLNIVAGVLQESVERLLRQQAGRQVLDKLEKAFKQLLRPVIVEKQAHVADNFCHDLSLVFAACHVFLRVHSQEIQAVVLFECANSRLNCQAAGLFPLLVGLLKGAYN